MNPNASNWLDIIRRQDELLVFPAPIANHDALTLGLYAIEQAKAFGYAFAIRVIANGAIVFSHHMDGVGLNNDWWMDKKLNASREAFSFLSIHQSLFSPTPSMWWENTMAPLAMTRMAKA